MTVIVTNRIPVSEGHTIDFEERFKRRVHLVDQSPGFIRNEVHRPRPVRYDRTRGEWLPDSENPGYYEVKTWWQSFEDFTAWTKSPSFAEAHRNKAPEGMFAGPNKLIIHEVFLSTDLEV